MKNVHRGMILQGLPHPDFLETEDRMDIIVDEPARRLFSRSIESLISDLPPESRLSEAEEYLRRLEHCRDKLPRRLLDEFREVVDDFARVIEGRPADALLPADYEQELTNRLFSLYVDLSGGALIF